MSHFSDLGTKIGEEFKVDRDRLDTVETKLGGIENNATADQVASEVPYSNIASGLTATDVQNAIDEVESRIDNLEVDSHTHSNKDILDATTASYTVEEETKLTNIENNANNYTLPVASTSIGGVKSGTDITVDGSGNVSVNNNSHSHTISNIDGLQTTLDNKLETSLKGSINGLAELDANGKIPAAQIPTIATTEVTVVADEAARLALVVQEGDIAIQSDIGSSYVYDGASWLELSSTETDPIFSASTVSNISNGIGFLKNNGSGTWSYDNNTYLTSYTETDTLDSVTSRDAITTNGITVGDVTTDSVQLTGGSGSEGTLAWNDSDRTLDLDQGGVTLQLGQETHFMIRNDSGSTIGNGTFLGFTGVTVGSNRIIAWPFDASTMQEHQLVGFATENISNGVNGLVTTFGYVRGLDTRGTAASSMAVGDEDWAVGDILYPHPTVAGKLTNVEPITGFKAKVAVITNRHQSAGEIFVRVTPHNERIDEYAEEAYGWSNHADAGYQLANTALTTSTNFGGDVSGTYDAIVVEDDSHNHVIANVDGLQDALDAKAPLQSPALTGTPTAPTAVEGTNTTQVATTAFVSTAVSSLVDAAPTTLNTLNELAAALGDDANFATTVSESIGTKLAISSNLSDLNNAATARTNLGLGSLATLSSVNAATITDNSVGAVELNVTGNGTASQFLRSDGDGTFTWATPSDTVYTHPAYTTRSINTSGAQVLDIFTSDALGSVTNITTRNLTLADLGYTGATNANNFTYTLPAATATTLGGIELFSNTIQSVAANAVTATSSRTYGVQLNSAGQAVVNVPWVDTNTNTTYTAGTGLTLTGTEFSVVSNPRTRITFNSGDPRETFNVSNPPTAMVWGGEYITTVIHLYAVGANSWPYLENLKVRYFIKGSVAGNPIISSSDLTIIWSDQDLYWDILSPATITVDPSAFTILSKQNITIIDLWGSTLIPQKFGPSISLGGDVSTLASFVGDYGWVEIEAYDQSQINNIEFYIEHIYN